MVSGEADAVDDIVAVIAERSQGGVDCRPVSAAVGLWTQPDGHSLASHRSLEPYIQSDCHCLASHRSLEPYIQSDGHCLASQSVGQFSRG